MLDIIETYPLVGQLLYGRYQIIQLLSAGAFGQTYLAEDIARPGKPKCVIKQHQPILNYPNLLKNSRRRFTTEVETLLKIGKHDHIPQLLDYFEENLGFYVVLEFIEGNLLDTELVIHGSCEKCDREQSTIKLLKDVLNILQFIHQRGIIHSDLKPNNIIKRAYDSQWVLIDFSGASLISTQRTNKIFGESLKVHPLLANSVLGYLPLEQLQGEVHPNSDIYALGMIGIQCLTGIQPDKFPLDLDTGEINWKQGFQNSETLPIFGETLTSILSQMVKRDYQQRYQSAREVLEALEPLIIHEDLPKTLADLPGFPNPPFLYASPVEPESDPIESETEEIITITSEDCSSQEYLSTQADILSQCEFQKDTKSQSKELREDSENLSLFITGLGTSAAILNSLTIALGVHSLLYSAAYSSEAALLAQAKEAYQNGKFAEAIALAKSVSSNSRFYEESQEVAQEWQEQWRFSASQYQVIQKEFQEKKWKEVILQYQKLPAISYWQAKTKPLVDKSKIELEKEAEDLLDKAYEYADKKDFTQALAYLRQIDPETPTGSKIQPKIEEYTAKEDIRANYLLQQAYDSAAKRDFVTAIQFLKQIPQHRVAGEIAQAKIEEYTKKQKIKQQGQKVSDINAGNTLQEINPQKMLTTARR
ncbi:MAG: protein kinase domain-containing protein [Chroococcales cyanobacterium]